MRKRSRQTEDMVETDMVSPHISIRHKSTTVKHIALHPFSSKLDLEHLPSHIPEGERVCIIASHPSSDNSTGEESALLYKVVSLGTFERVAPKWVRDVIKFSTSMSPVFFDRVSRVLKPRF
ncbi:hypothetical protein ARALYDRAFT_912213 [Arabidopsis lyrata subsp. lyrata]|uniref:DUF7806 domain-containing protein n=1 Tax=Arabidopsis lyrata subsp. lyrata TaxID=81972 RepID=D7M5Q1_ARALL|nr:hypothetical protein ARALYDRAFT_912213 [Arabidopsis lyrata subsp. lyrata]